MKLMLVVGIIGGATLWVAACDAPGATNAATGPSAPMTTPLTPGQGPLIGTAAHDHHSASVVGSRGIAPLSANQNSQLNELRQFVAPFHNFDKAVEAGYNIPAPGPGVCISHPTRGGMGFHYTYAHRDLISDGRVNLLEPEFLVYAPKPNGGVKFAALDYFVPYNTWSSPEPPALLGVPFAREDDFQAYVLHIWLFWHNPAGMFENYNPEVPLC
jgi:hypothetical protein